MAVYRVQREWSGYSRGYDVYEVEASSEEEAKDIALWSGDLIETVTVRDDTETTSTCAEKL